MRSKDGVLETSKRCDKLFSRRCRFCGEDINSTSSNVTGLNGISQSLDIKDLRYKDECVNIYEYI